MRSGQNLKLKNSISQLSAAAVVYEYVSTEKCALSALLSVSRPEPAPADCSLATGRRADRASGAKQRRYTVASPSSSSIVLLLLLAVGDNILNFKDHAIFRFDLMTQVVGFWAKV